ncbi:hypothetical protein FSB78_06010 [Sphingomonas ginsenosidivorax]|uniref:Uncharacterized protein n=1 Tax=Sphingomonas ginsenosidivorax TaxID=862135 RepID=A0A5C6UCT4_9SPHN|nr:hypothetical protein [Sphingomonas ginsenosidivorax]TXC70543.1 hypothetical protein FSB78_06010 [Sphingomonas ginsenosidivorax]
MLDRARVAAAHHLGHRGYAAEADAIRKGLGDDFAEVRIALQILAGEDDRFARLERALATYAAASFWAYDVSGLTAADLDEGDLARHALAGTAPPGRYHE